jgi:hypothetical protein
MMMIMAHWTIAAWCCGSRSYYPEDGVSAAVDPGEGALDGPPAVQDDERGLPGEFGHDLHGEVQVVGGPVDELAGVAGIGPEQAGAGEAGVHRPEQRAGIVTVLDVAAGDRDGEQQSAGVDRDAAAWPG